MGVEGLAVCIPLLAATRFDRSYAITMLATMTASFIMSQSGASLAGRVLLQSYPANLLLACSMSAVAAVVVLLIVMEALTGGTWDQAGSWDPLYVIPMYVAIGACLGVAQVCRRAVPACLVGSCPRKLRRLDSDTHIFYQVTGLIGAYLTTPIVASTGCVYGLLLLPPFFCISAICYSQIDIEQHKRRCQEQQQQQQLPQLSSPRYPQQQQQQQQEEVAIQLDVSGFYEAKEIDYMAATSSQLSITSVDRMSSTSCCQEEERAAKEEGEGRDKAEKVEEGREGGEDGGGGGGGGAVLAGLRGYLHLLRVGARIVFSRQKFVWLLFGYTLPFTLHRLIETLLLPAFAVMILHFGAYSGILLGSSNTGELLGALAVMVLGRHVPTPLPFVRWDALAQGLLWAFVRHKPPVPQGYVFSVIPFMFLVSGGWAAGDVSLLAYIQSQMGLDYDDLVDGVSPLGAVMSFLYLSYVLLYTAVAIGTGRVFDFFYNTDAPEVGFYWVAGVFCSVSGVAILASTFVPPGSWALNPRMPEVTFSWEKSFNNEGGNSTNGSNSADNSQHSYQQQRRHHPQQQQQQPHNQHQQHHGQNRKAPGGKHHHHLRREHWADEH